MPYSFHRHGSAYSKVAIGSSTGRERIADLVRQIILAAVLWCLRWRLRHVPRSILPASLRWWWRSVLAARRWRRRARRAGGRLPLELDRHGGCARLRGVAILVSIDQSQAVASVDIALCRPLMNTKTISCRRMNGLLLAWCCLSGRQRNGPRATPAVSTRRGDWLDLKSREVKPRRCRPL